MDKILWLSQHAPLPKQLAELNGLFGDVQVVEDTDSFRGAEEIKQRYKNGQYRDLVVVAPLSVIAKLCELGIKPLWAQMQQVQTQDEADLEYRNRFYRFEKFKRIKAVKLIFEEV